MLSLVTGGCGFIGSHLVDALLAGGDEVRVVDNLATGNRENLNPRGPVRLFEGDIRDPELLRRAMDGVDVVFHQAALPSVPRSIADPISCHDVNATGTFQVLMAARDTGVRRVVFASSSSVYGDTAELPKREGMTPRPLSPYALAKLTGEHYCRLFHELYGLEAVALRYFNVFGPRQDPNSAYAAAIPKFIRLITAGERPVVYGDGEQTRDFTAVGNVVAANLGAATSSAAPGRVYNVGCGSRVSLNELLRKIGRVTGCEVVPEYRPAKAGDVRDSLADITAARRDLGYAPRITLEQGLAELVEAVRMPVAA